MEHNRVGNEEEKREEEETIKSNYLEYLSTTRYTHKSETMNLSYKSVEWIEKNVEWKELRMLFQK